MERLFIDTDAGNCSGLLEGQPAGDGSLEDVPGLIPGGADDTVSSKHKYSGDIAVEIECIVAVPGVIVEIWGEQFQLRNKSNQPSRGTVLRKGDVVEVVSSEGGTARVELRGDALRTDSVLTIKAMDGWIARYELS